MISVKVIIKPYLYTIWVQSYFDGIDISSNAMYKFQWEGDVIISLVISQHFIIQETQYQMEIEPKIRRSYNFQM